MNHVTAYCSEHDRLLYRPLLNRIKHVTSEHLKTLASFPGLPAERMKQASLARQGGLETRL